MQAVQRRFRIRAATTVLIAAAAACAAQTGAVTARRAQNLVLNRSSYEARAGEPIVLDAPSESVRFLRDSEQEQLSVEGRPTGVRFAIGRDGSDTHALLFPSLRTPPGEYSVTIAVSHSNGEQRTATVHVVVDPLQPVPSIGTRPPVILLNGWQAICTASQMSDTFGDLRRILLAAGAPAVYFFDNCVEGANQKIEDLGNALAQVLNLIHYDTGAPVPQFDLVAHSMGGLIARAYLAGLQSNGQFVPPANPHVRKLVLIATPNFGSYKALNIGQQTAEMIPGSALLWELGTWNQGGDDLRGVDALAIIGNAGQGNTGDGVVSLTSASLGFARDQSRTRILPYCHTASSFFTGILGAMDCTGTSIAKSPEALTIVSAFLADDFNGWPQDETTPVLDPFLSQYGGMFFTLADSNANFKADVSAASFGSVPFQSGGATGSVFYKEFVRGTGAAQFTSASLGQVSCSGVTAPVGYFRPFRCKFAPIISSVGPLLQNTTARIVQSGAWVTLNGAGFGGGCPSCVVLAYPGPVTLQVSSWTDQAITAYLPSYSGYAQLSVRVPGGADVIGIMTAPAPVISVAPRTLEFSYEIGNPPPPTQSVQISNTGGGTLSWTATSSAAWLHVTPPSGIAQSPLSISIDTAGLTAGKYAGTISIAAAGASPVTIVVSLTVASPAVQASTPSLTLTGQAGGSGSTQIISVSASAPLSFAATTSTISGGQWLSVSPPSGNLPATLTVTASAAELQAGTYQGSVSVTALGASNSPLLIPVSFAVSAASSPVSIVAVLNGASFVEGFAPGSWVTIKGTNLARTTRIWTAADIVGGVLPTQMDGVRVTIDGVPAAIYYVSPTQLNILAPALTDLSGARTVQVSAPDGTATASAHAQAVAPRVFATGGKYAAALHVDGSYVCPPDFLAGVGCRSAVPGEVIAVFATGLGLDTIPAAPVGVVLSGPAPMAHPVTITVGGQSAPVDWSGIIAPGLYQVNFHVPPLAVGDTPLVVAIDGVSSRGSFLLPIGSPEPVH
jgi:uncharacterized protein (TIGR03437 family)